MRHWRRLLPLAAGSVQPVNGSVSFIANHPAMSFSKQTSALSTRSTADPPHSTQSSSAIEPKDSNQESCDADEADDSLSKPLPKIHTLTVCIVPPPSNMEVWQTLSQMRELLQDPGFFRWPPHINLLYPFINYETEACQENGLSLEETVDLLCEVTKQCAPFTVSLNSLGTFGGRQRGVLWLSPNGQSNGNFETSSDDLMALHAKLEEAFPMCTDLSQKGSAGKYTPHMTLSHFTNLTAALDAKALLEEKFSLDGLSFLMDRIYLLQRKGDGGQFHRVAEILFGSEESSSNDAGSQIHDPPLPFPGMPTTEVDWVYQQRMALKKRRNWSGRRGNKSHRRRRTDGLQVADTPEEIARKRAERKLKKERLEQEQQRAGQARSDGDLS